MKKSKRFYKALPDKLEICPDCLEKLNMDEGIGRSHVWMEHPCSLCGKECNTHYDFPKTMVYDALIMLKINASSIYGK